MRKQDFLIHLIKSLTPNEQRYFKLFSNIQSGEKGYLKLFEELEGKDEYNAAALGKSLDLTPASLAEKKHYLNHVLLQALRQVQKESNNSIIRRQVDEACLMLDRRHFDYALNITEKALIRCWETEYFEPVTELLRVKTLCCYALEMEQNLPALMSERNKAETALAELFELHLLGIEATNLQARNAPLKDWQKLMRNQLLKKDVKQLHSLRAQVAWFDIMFRYLLSAGNKQASREMSRREVDHYIKHPKIKAITPIAWVASFSRLANADFELGKLEEALQAIAQFDTQLNDRTLTISEARRASLKYYAALYRAHLLRCLERFEESLVLTEKCYHGRTNRPVSEQFAITYEYAVLLFVLGQPAKALVKINELLEVKEDVRPDLQCLARILLVMIHVDEANYALVPYVVKATRLWLKRHKSTIPGTDLFLKCLNNIAKARPGHTKQQWAKLKAALGTAALKELTALLNLNAWAKRK